MKIWMIWARDGDCHWLESAWDEDSRADNYAEWEVELNTTQKQNGADNVRVLCTDLNLDTVKLAYEPPRVSNNGIKEITE